MPDFFVRTPPIRSLPKGLTISALCAALLALSGNAASNPAVKAAAAEAASAAPEPVGQSALDAPLFYQLLMGEMQLQAGEAGNAFQILLDAARRTGDEVLFRRVVGIALRARAGDQALLAARAWREHVPESLEAAHTTLQLIVNLNRPSELAEPLNTLLRLTPTGQRAAALVSLPRTLARMPEPQRVLAALEPVLQPYLKQEPTREAAHVALARLRAAAGDTSGALTLLESAAQGAPEAPLPALAALDMMDASPRAEALVKAHLIARPDSNLVRLNYGRVLARGQRHGDAVRELQIVTQFDPRQLGAWMSLGALQAELKHPAEAEVALRAYLEQADAASKAGETGPELSAEAKQQAYLLLAQIAEQSGELSAAEGWLALVGDTKTAMQVQYRRASLLSRQGKLEEGRKLLQALPEKNEEDAKAKLVVESQLLREARQWQAAYDVLEAGNRRFKDSTDMLYEQSMMAEKLDRMEEMERLLRRVIELKPDHHHAYNALGYSLADRNLRLDEAKGLIERAIEMAPNEPFLLDSLGWVEFRMGRADEALRWLSQAYRSRPDTEIAAHLGEVLWTLGRQDEAKRIWREGSLRDRDNEVLRETLKRLRVTP